MATKTATITLDGEMRFVGRVGSGHEIVLDDGRSDTGARPSELIPLALAGCTAMDVISILRKKQQAVTGYSVDAAGIQDDDHPNAFRRIDVTHVVTGKGVDVAAVRRSIELSATKYCSVGTTLASGRVEVHHHFVLRDVETGEEHRGSVLVEGPFADAAALAASGRE